MHLDEEEQDIYSQLNGDKKTELNALFKSTDFWNKLPKIAAGVICAGLVIAFIF